MNGESSDALILFFRLDDFLIYFLKRIHRYYALIYKTDDHYIRSIVDSVSVFPSFRIVAETAEIIITHHGLYFFLGHTSLNSARKFDVIDGRREE